jgi:hypothetical protein
MESLPVTQVAIVPQLNAGYMAVNNNKEGFIPLHGGYRNLITYQKSEIIYDGTVYFCNHFFKKYDRTIDQMVQAARSGKQILPKQVWHQPPQKKQKLNLPMLHGQV